MRLMFLISLAIFANLSFAKSYVNPSANLIYQLNADGTVNVHEEIVYSISCPSSDCFYELYTWHPSSLEIVDASGYCKETDCVFYTQYNKGNYELVLRKETGFKTGVYTAVFDYTLKGEILEQKDAAQFFYKIWYDQWPKQISKLTMKIILPGPVSDVVFFTHNSTPSSIYAGGNEISLVAENYPANSYYEINLLMPKEWFNNLRIATNYMTKEEIIRGEERYLGQTNNNFLSLLSMLYTILLILAPLALLLYLYYTYGKEEDFPELNSLPPYVRDISEIDKDIPPTEAAVLLNPISANKKDLELISRVIAAETMELIRLGYLEVEEREIRGIIGSNKKIEFTIVPNKDPAGLTEIQKTILDFMKSNLESNGKFSFERDFGLSFEAFSASQKYKYLFIGLVNNLFAKAVGILKSKNYIDMTGVNLMNRGFFIWFVIAIISGVFIPQLIGGLSFLLFISIFLWLFIILFINMKPDLLGRWTKEGRIRHEKMKRYHKFMEDLTLMKEKNIKDVILWERLLVYATAFGIADKVIRSMEVVIPEYKSNVKLRTTSVLATSLAASTRRAVFSYVHQGKSVGGFGGGRGGGGGGGGAR
ncbi:MAG: DUF2207 domain-containing protein [Candidatus Micrarchaeota archaeon]|nr:DUF2207 domain-containing protein [Candidatus Micrarchaeota archaeon]